MYRFPPEEVFRNGLYLEDRDYDAYLGTQRFGLEHKTSDREGIIVEAEDKVLLALGRKVWSFENAGF